MIDLKKVIIIIISMLGLLVQSSLFYSDVKAEENKQQTVYYLDSKGIVNGTLISKEDLLWPGKTIEKEFYIVNNNSFDCYIKDFVIEGKLYDSNNRIIDKNEERYYNFMNNSNISIYSDDKEIFKKNAADFIDIQLKNNDTISIGKFSKKRFILRFTLGESTDKSTMNIFYNFNMTTNFFSIDNALVQTGYLIDNKFLIIIGLILCGTGASFILKHKFLYINR